MKTLSTAKKTHNRGQRHWLACCAILLSTAIMSPSTLAVTQVQMPQLGHEPSGQTETPPEHAQTVVYVSNTPIFPNATATGKTRKTPDGTLSSPYPELNAVRLKPWTKKVVINGDGGSNNPYREPLVIGEGHRDLLITVASLSGKTANPQVVIEGRTNRLLAGIVLHSRGVTVDPGSLGRLIIRDVPDGVVAYKGQETIAHVLFDHDDLGLYLASGDNRITGCEFLNNATGIFFGPHKELSGVLECLFHSTEDQKDLERELSATTGIPVSQITGIAAASSVEVDKSELGPGLDVGIQTDSSAKGLEIDTNQTLFNNASHAQIMVAGDFADVALNIVRTTFFSTNRNSDNLTHFSVYYPQGAGRTGLYSVILYGGNLHLGYWSRLAYADAVAQYDTTGYDVAPHVPLPHDGADPIFKNDFRHVANNASLDEQASWNFTQRPQLLGVGNTAFHSMTEWRQRFGGIQCAAGTL